MLSTRKSSIGNLLKYKNVLCSSITRLSHRNHQNSRNKSHFIFSKKYSIHTNQLHSVNHAHARKLIPKNRLVPFYKITNEIEKHNGYQYKNGLNILKEKFNPERNSGGGFHFTDIDNLHHFLDFGCNIRKVYIPTWIPNIRVVNVSGYGIKKWKTNFIIFDKKYSLKTIDPYQKYNLCGEKYLMWNIMNGNENVLDYLLRTKPELYSNIPDVFRFSMYGQYPNITKILIDHGFDFHADDEYVLRHAAMYGYFDLVKYVVDRGANIHAMRDFAFRMSTKNGHRHIAQYLIDNGAYIHQE